MTISHHELWILTTFLLLSSMLINVGYSQEPLVGISPTIIDSDYVEFGFPRKKVPVTQTIAPTQALFNYSNLNDRINLAMSCLNAINFRRTFHSAQGLNFDSELAEQALKKASFMDWRNMSKNISMEATTFGELSIYLKKEPKTPNCGRYIEKFYQERNDYVFNVPNDKMLMNHFTQLIWNSSQRAGCATIRKYIVCLFNPPGNIRSQMKKNVFPWKDPSQ